MDYTMDEYNGRAFQQYVRQASAASGTIPSASTLDQIIKSELAKAYQHQYEGQQLALNKQRLAEHSREFGLEMEQADANRMASSATGLLGSAAQLGTMYTLGMPYIKDRLYRKATGDLYGTE